MSESRLEGDVVVNVIRRARGRAVAELAEKTGDVITASLALDGNLYQLPPGNVEYGDGYAHVRVTKGEKTEVDSQYADETIDALFRAIKGALEKHGEDLSCLEIREMRIVAAPDGIVADSIVQVTLCKGDKWGRGRAVHRDTIRAVATAFILAINYTLYVPKVENGRSL